MVRRTGGFAMSRLYVAGDNKRRPDGTYRDVREHGEKPREEWIAVPDAGVPREVAERARRNVELRLPAPRADRRVWELSGGFAACAECGRGMSGRTIAPKGRKRDLPGKEVARREREAARGARFRELYAMLGLRAAVHADGELDIAVGATNTKGVMPCNEQG